MASALKFLLPFLYPLSLSLLLSGIGVALLWSGRKRRLGRGLCTIGFLVLLIPGNAWVSKGLLSLREFHHPALQDNDLARLGTADVVVLGGGVSPQSDLPPTSQLSSTSLQRLVEGIRLQRISGGRLILSGGGGANRSEADLMGQLARELGVDPAVIVLEEASMNTSQQATNLHPLLAGKPFVLVTAADHMPRAIGDFQSLGLKPVAAPSGHNTRTGVRGIRNVISQPDTSNLNAWERGLYEFLAGLQRDPAQPVETPRPEREEERIAGGVLPGTP